SLELIEDASRRIEHRRSADLDARDMVMRGRALFNRPYSAGTLREAQEAFEGALDKDSGSIDAKIGIASVLLTTIANAWSTKREAAVRLSGQPRLGLPRDVRRVIVQNNFDRSCGRVGSVEDFEELDELATAVAVLDERMHSASKQIDAGHQGHSAVALVLMVA